MALCPYFAQTNILDGLEPEKLKKKLPLDFVPVEKVGDAFEEAVKNSRLLKNLGHSMQINL